MVSDHEQINEDRSTTKRAHSIAELEEKLEKIKSQRQYNLKNKLAKKSLNSKLNKKIKKTERLNKTRVKGESVVVKKEKEEVKPNPIAAKPVFNNDGKLVFSKFDFSNVGQRGT